MQGYINALNHFDDIASVRSEAGDLYRFKAKALKDSVSFLDLNMDDLVAFDLENVDGKAVVKNLYIVQKAEECPYYSLKEKMEFLEGEGDLCEGYEIFDLGSYAIFRGDKSLDGAKERLKEYASSLGATSLFDLKVKKKVRNSMGYGFPYYICFARPAVIAKKDQEGEYTKEDLKKLLDHHKILKDRKNEELQKTMTLSFKIVCALMLLIFLMGFIFSK